MFTNETITNTGTKILILDLLFDHIITIFIGDFIFFVVSLSSKGIFIVMFVAQGSTKLNSNCSFNGIISVLMYGRLDHITMFDIFYVTMPCRFITISHQISISRHDIPSPIAIPKIPSTLYHIQCFSIKESLIPSIPSPFVSYAQGTSTHPHTSAPRTKNEGGRDI